jgi:hypothetical protein
VGNILDRIKGNPGRNRRSSAACIPQIGKCFRDWVVRPLENSQSYAVPDPYHTSHPGIFSHKDLKRLIRAPPEECRCLPHLYSQSRADWLIQRKSGRDVRRTSHVRRCCLFPSGPDFRTQVSPRKRKARGKSVAGVHISILIGYTEPIIVFTLRISFDKPSENRRCVTQIAIFAKEGGA